MKEGRRLGGVHAGPESRVLEGVTWESLLEIMSMLSNELKGTVHVYIFFQILMRNSKGMKVY